MSCSRCGSKLSSIIRGAHVSEPGASSTEASAQPIVNRTVRANLLTRKEVTADETVTTSETPAKTQRTPRTPKKG